MTFIEVLVAFVIIATGILGAVAMQATAKKASYDSMQRSLASSLAEDIIARMRSNDVSALASYESDTYGRGNYTQAAPERCASIGTKCDKDEIVANDQYEWELALMGKDALRGGNPVGGLINALGCIDVDGNNVTVVISWHGREKIKDAAKATCGTTGGSTGDKLRQIVVESYII